MGECDGRTGLVPYNMISELPTDDYEDPGVRNNSWQLVEHVHVMLVESVGRDCTLPHS